MASQRILATGTITAGGDVQWRIAPLVTAADEEPWPLQPNERMGELLPAQDVLTDEEWAQIDAHELAKDDLQCLQYHIDAMYEAELAQDWEDYRLEQEWLDHWI